MQTETESPPPLADMPADSRLRSPWLDAAVLLAVLSALMYALGWLYWAAFFREFGVDSSMIDLPPEKVVASTWCIVLVVPYMAWGVVLNIERPRRLRVSGIASIAACLVVFIPLTLWGAWGLIGLIPATLLIRVVHRARSDPPLRAIWSESDKPMLLSAIAMCLLLLAWYCTMRGQTDALSTMRRRRAPLVRLRVVEGARAPKEGVLVGHLSGGYVVWGKVGTQAARTYIIPDSAVLSAEVRR